MSRYYKVMALIATFAPIASGEWCGGKPGQGQGGPCRIEGPASPADQVSRVHG